jgi:hypothetical protein
MNKMLKKAYAELTDAGIPVLGVIGTLQPGRGTGL